MSELFIELALIAMIVVPAVATALHPAPIVSRACPEPSEKLHPTA